MALDKRYCFGKGIDLIEGINNFIGLDEKTGLVRDGSSDKLLDTFENSSFAIANFLAGKDEVSYKILQGIEEHIGFNKKGLVYNKIGLSKNEETKTLPGEKTIYLANNGLLSSLYWLVGEKEKSKILRDKIDKNIGKFEYRGESFCRHESNKKHFYPFNNLIMAINDLIIGETSSNLIQPVEEVCLDKTGLIRGEPNSKIYFTLDNALRATYYAFIKDDKAKEILKNLEDAVGFDSSTNLINRGALGSIELIAPNDKENTGIAKGLQKFHPIKDVLTYTNSAMAIAYLSLATN